MGSKLRCVRPTPTEMQPMSENDFECSRARSVNTPETMSEPLIFGPFRTPIQEMAPRVL